MWWNNVDLLVAINIVWTWALNCLIILTYWLWWWSFRRLTEGIHNCTTLAHIRWQDNCYQFISGHCLKWWPLKHMVAIDLDTFASKGKNSHQIQNFDILVSILHTNDGHTLFTCRINIKPNCAMKWIYTVNLEHLY